MKKVLIALDYDPTAQKVAEEGHAIAKAMNAQTLLIHVVADPVYYSSTAYSPIMGFGGFNDTAMLQPEIVDGFMNASRDFLARSKEHLGDTNIQTDVKEGDVADAILAAAKDFSADMIVMGSHSRKWLESIVMGSITEEVLHRSNVPLFIIPTKKQA